MAVLITAKEAKKLVSGSEERKCELIHLVNSIIKDQAAKGLRWAHFPIGISEEEKEYLSGILTENGFTISESNPNINW